MNYISSKQAAQLWGISPRRVAILASQGRIDGAVSLGNTWLIPEDAHKPSDSRRKANRSGAKSTGHGYCPYIVSAVHSEEQVSRFNSEERELYRADLMYEAGDLKAARQTAERLLFSRDRDIRLGSLYLLALVCLYQGDHNSTEKNSVLFLAEYHNSNEHSPEHTTLFIAFELEMGRVSGLVNMELSPELSDCSPDYLPTAAFQKMYAEVVRVSMGGKMPDVSVYELICLMTDNQGYFYCGMLMHLTLALLYSASDNYDMEYRHIRRALDISIEHNILFSFATMTSGSSDALEAVMRDCPPEIAARIGELTEQFLRARVEYSKYQKKQQILSKIKGDDYRLLSFCVRKYSIEKMAGLFGLSKSGINRRLTNLYRKLGVSSKKEMEKVFLSAVFDWGVE